jgi:predicted DNA-binding protein
MAKTEELVAMNVRIPISLHEEINRLAEFDGRSKQITVKRLLEKAIAKERVA